MKYRSAVWVLLIVFAVIYLSTRSVYAYEIYPDTSTTIPMVSSTGPSTASFWVPQSIPDSISGIRAWFRAKENPIAQYLNPATFYTRFDDGIKRLMGISVTGILQTIGSAFVWIINLTATVLNFVSNLIAGGLAHL